MVGVERTAVTWMFGHSVSSTSRPTALTTRSWSYGSDVHVVGYLNTSERRATSDKKRKDAIIELHSTFVRVFVSVSIRVCAFGRRDTETSNSNSNNRCSVRRFGTSAGM